MEEQSKIDKQTILIVDDSDINREILASMLEEEFDILEAKDGVQAVECLKQDKDKISLVLLDVIMPKMDGFGVLQVMGEYHWIESIPVIMISSDNSGEYVKRAYELGVSDYIDRQMNALIILKRVSNIIHLATRQNRLVEMMTEENRILQQQNYRLVNLDGLTGCLNFEGFKEHAKQLIQENPKYQYALCYCDIKQFKYVNDTFGYGTGDTLLQYMVRVLQDSLQVGEICGRVSGDQFLVLVRYKYLENLEKRFWAVARRISPFLSQPGRNYNVELAVGVYPVKEEDIQAVDINHMIDWANQTQKNVKGVKGSQFALYDDTLREKQQRVREIQRHLPEALRNGEIRIYLQPQFDYTTNKISGAEALCRWFHNTLGFISPGEFIPILEHTGQVTELDMFVWEEACRCLSRWKRDDTIAQVALSVNISRIDIQEINVKECFLGLMEKYQLSPHQLHLEITESAYIGDSEDLLSTIGELQEAGFLIEMDDFGSGFSSLNMLKEVPVDVLKLDMRFLRESGQAGKSGVILSSVIRMSHELEIPVIAEGVETESHADMLKAMGCSFMQGYFFAKPMAVPEFEEMVRKQEAEDIYGVFHNSGLRDINALLDPQSTSFFIFHQCIGSAMVLEFYGWDAHALLINDAMYRLLGSKGEKVELFRFNWIQAVAPEDRQAVKAAMQKAVDSGSAACELTFSGFLPRLHVNFHCISKGSDGAVLFSVYEKANTEKEQLETALTMMRDNYYRIACIDLEANSMKNLVIGLDEQGDNEFFERDYSGAIRAFAKNFLNPEHQEKFLNLMLPENLRQIFSDGAQYVDITYQRKIKGVYHWVRTELMPVPDNSPGIGKVMWYVKNVTEEQQAEGRMSQLLEDNARLQRTLSREEQYRQAILSEAMMVFNVNVSGDMIEDEIYEMADGHTIKLLSSMNMEVPCSFNAFCVKWCEERVEPDDRQEFLRVMGSRNLSESYEKGEKKIQLDYRARLCTGDKVTLQQTMMLARDKWSGDIIALCDIRNITGQREKESSELAALQEAYEAANKASVAKGDFLLRMSYEIQTPLSSIMGLTSVADTYIGDKERVVDCLNKITASGRYLLGLLDEIKDMGKIESGRIMLSEELFTLSEVIDNVINISDANMKKSGHKLKTNLHGVDHEWIAGDPVHLQQILLNIMSNAIKYTPNGGKITLSVRELPSPSPKMGNYEFVVEDTGIGMSKELVEKIFDPFTRSEDSRVRKIDGSGLGMSITKKIVAMMGGEIRIDSEPGVGTKVTVAVSLKLQDGRDPGYLDLRERKVLVMGQEREECEGIVRSLREMGLDSRWVFSDEEAAREFQIALEEEDGYYAAFIDWDVFSTDQIEEICRFAGDGVKLIGFSDKSLEELEKEKKAVGIDLFIRKPLFPSKLAQIFLGLGDTDTHNNPNNIYNQEFAGKTVLLVEDNELNAEIAKDILETVGLRVDLAENGKTAVEKFKASQEYTYDLIFMDIQMPVMNGYEAARAIRAVDRPDAGKIPIVAMTANAFGEAASRSKEAGMNEHLTKPLDFGKLANILNRWM